MKRLMSLAVVLMGLLVFAAPAQATLIDFTSYPGSPASGNAVSYVYTSGSLSVTATAYYTMGGGPVAASVYREGISSGLNGGLGVTSVVGADGAANGIGGQVDGQTATDSLVLTFNQTVTLDSAIFSRLGTQDDDDQVRIYAATNTGANYIYFGTPAGANGSDTGISGTVNFSGAGRTNTVFRLTVDDSNDDYMLRSLNVTYNGEGPVIPEPGSMALLGIGLLGLLRRKKV